MSRLSDDVKNASFEQDDKKLRISRHQYTFFLSAIKTKNKRLIKELSNFQRTRQKKYILRTLRALTSLETTRASNCIRLSKTASVTVNLLGLTIVWCKLMGFVCSSTSLLEVSLLLVLLAETTRLVALEISWAGSHRTALESWSTTTKYNPKLSASCQSSWFYFKMINCLFM